MEAEAVSTAMAGTMPSIINIARTALIKAGRRNRLVVASMYIPQKFMRQPELRNQSLLSQTLQIVTCDLQFDSHLLRGASPCDAGMCCALSGSDFQEMGQPGLNVK
ncbi:hypothetical protein [Pseudarthrobacter sp. H2]|uniref:hypothetical protein n=1 Tax=Pseudarthrobacter sp. H2 TaxID=3418415 RepID=UPI003CF1B016